jgi:hypothetical protein
MGRSKPGCRRRSAGLSAGKDAGPLRQARRLVATFQTSLMFQTHPVVKTFKLEKLFWELRGEISFTKLSPRGLEDLS